RLGRSPFLATPKATSTRPVELSRSGSTRSVNAIRPRVTVPCSATPPAAATQPQVILRSGRIPRAMTTPLRGPARLLQIPLPTATRPAVLVRLVATLPAPQIPPRLLTPPKQNPPQGPN